LRSKISRKSEPTRPADADKAAPSPGFHLQLKQLGIERLFLFGSVARDEAREDSDVDFFFDDQKGRLDLFDLMDIKERASTILGRSADISSAVGEQGGGTPRK
jgi:predicted nucleotidyltransferase